MLSEAEQEREGERESARERETDEGMQRPNGGPRSKGHALLVSLSLARASSAALSLPPRGEQGVRAEKMTGRNAPGEGAGEDARAFEEMKMR